MDECKILSKKVKEKQNNEFKMLLMRQKFICINNASSFIKQLALKVMHFGYLMKCCN